MASKDFVTIVSGLPRSGTSMMMRMLEAGGIPPITDNLRQPDEDNPMGYYEFEPAKKLKDDPSFLAGAEGKSVKMVYQLLYDLPTDRQYRVLVMRRNIDEVLASQKKMLERLGKGDGGISDDRMAALFRAQLAKFAAWVAGQSHIQHLDVDYNRVMAEPMAEIARITAFLGEGMDREAMASVVDPSLYRNRR